MFWGGFVSEFVGRQLEFASLTCVDLTVLTGHRCSPEKHCVSCEFSEPGSAGVYGPPIASERARDGEA